LPNGSPFVNYDIYHNLVDQYVLNVYNCKKIGRNKFENYISTEWYVPLENRITLLRGDSGYGKTEESRNYTLE
jgi:hypothetical protein